MCAQRHPRPGTRSSADATPRTGLARALSKLGYCSRSQAVKLITEGRVTHNGRICRETEWPVHLARDRLQVDGHFIDHAPRVYYMLNKPRGVVTTTADEQGRATIYQALEGHDLPWLAPVGRLDKASEGLLLLSNDTAWAARITAPASGVEKTYHLQVNRQVSSAVLQQMLTGIPCAETGVLAVKHVSVLRTGQRTCWLEVVLDEGRNRHLRRIAQALDLTVVRLIRIGIGGLSLGDLAKGSVRALVQADFDRLGIQPSPPP